MIFVTVGSMFPFDRLAQAADAWARRNASQDVLVQIGEGRFVPKHARWVRMMRPGEFNDTISACDLVVAHLGMGSIITAMQAQKPVVLMPRIYELGEHTSDHQMHGTEWLRDKPGIWIAKDESELQQLLDEYVVGNIASPSEKATSIASPELIARVRQFILDNGKT